MASLPPSARDGCANSMPLPSRSNPRASNKLLMYVAAVLRLYDSMMDVTGRLVRENGDEPFVWCLQTRGRGCWIYKCTDPQNPRRYVDRSFVPCRPRGLSRAAVCQYLRLSHRCAFAASSVPHLVASGYSCPPSFDICSTLLAYSSSPRQATCLHAKARINSRSTRMKLCIRSSLTYTR